MPDRVIKELSKGEPISRMWVYHIAFGAVLFGCLSVPSSGAAIALIPMFLGAGVLTFLGLRFRLYDSIRSRRLIAVGLGLMIMASWTRAMALWGLGQQGVGSNAIASAVWLWITALIAMALVAVWNRGVD